MYYKDLVAAAETDITCRNFRSLVDAAVKHYQKETSPCRNYRELGSAAETDITARNFCSLVDAADKLYEEEISNCDTEIKNGVTRSNPQRDHQNLDGASTSSSRNPSLLLDLNTIKSYRELRSAAENDISSRRFCALVDVAGVFHEEEEEEERDKRIFRLFPRKTRTSVKNGVPRRNPQGYHQNLNGASTSSSRNPLQCPSRTVPPDDDSGMDYLQNPNSSTSSLLPNPRNPNSQEKKTSRKRRAAQDKRPCGKFKKAKVDDTYSWIGRETPESLVQLMNETVIERGERTDLKLIFQKKLFQTDVNPDEGRLSMPFNKLIRNDFLTPVESTVIEEDINNGKKTGIGAVFFDQRKVKWGVMLKRWEMKGTWNYALNCGWNDVVEANRLKQGDDISIWSFRWGGVLCFALVTPPPSFHGAE